MNNNDTNNKYTNSFPTGPYPPFGKNDNNFARQRFPSNVFPPNGGMSGNPNANFNGITTNTMRTYNSTPSISNFNQAYNNPDPLIEKLDFNNQNDLLHNNVGDIVLDEHIVEYRINIDSLDRDTNVYPNPFDFVVKFAPPARSTITTNVPIDGNRKNGTKLQRELFEGPPKPHINRDFRNVKYIKLETVILPRHSELVEDEDGVWVFDRNSNLADDRFVQLSIKELDCNRIYNTMDGSLRYNSETGDSIKTEKPFAIIIPDKFYGTSYYSGTPYYGNKIYKSSLLGNIDQLSIKFYNSSGVPIKCVDSQSGQLPSKLCDPNEKIPITDLRNPLNKKRQVFISFIIGVVESQISTNTKFEK